MSNTITRIDYAAARKRLASITDDPAVLTGFDRIEASGDNIGDFRQSDGDLIDVSAYGFSSNAEMTLTDLGANSLIEFGPSGAEESVTLLGFDDPGQLGGSDFIFA